MGIRRLWKGLMEELSATLAVVRHTSPMFWFVCVGLIFVPFATAGLLPLGWFSLVVQSVTLSLFGVCMMVPEVLAREFRRDDVMGLKDRESGQVVTYLPPLMVLAAVPFYLLGQAVLFRLTMQHMPGVLPGDSWSDAWLLSINNVLYTEIFLDVVDIFRLGIVPDPQHRLGQVMVLVTRAMLSLAFIRVLLQILRAAWYRAHGLGRGSDLLARLGQALGERDLAEVRHTTSTIAANMGDTIETLVKRLGGPARESAWHGLHALRDWAIPHLQRRSRENVSEREALHDIVARLRQPAPPVAPVAQGVRLDRALAILAMIVVSLALVAIVPGWPGLVVGTTVLTGFGWLLVTPRTSIEHLMRFGVIPPFSAARLSRVTLIWAAGLSAILLVAGFFVFETAVHVATDAFIIADPVVGRRDIAEFVVSNLLRLQLFFGVPDAFGLWTTSLEQRPVLGSALTLLFRTTLNVGSIAILLTALSVSYDRAVTGSRLLGNDELSTRIEALRPGAFGPELAGHHADIIREELWERLTDTADPVVREALVVGGAYDWVTVHPPKIGLGDMTALSTVAVGLSRSGWPDEAVVLVEAIEGDARVEILFPQDRIHVMVDRSLVLDAASRHEEALVALRAAGSLLEQTAAEMTAADRTAAGSAVEAARDIVKLQTPDPPAVA